MFLPLAFENLHVVLRTLFDKMLPLCSEMTAIASGIAGLGALLYISYRVWQSLARAEPIDVFPLLRPFALGLCILFFEPLVLGTINGVGRVRIMLTLRSGSTLRLAEDSTISDSTGGQTKQEKQVLTVNRGSGRQEVVVTQQLYPTYQGAVVVCEGAGSSTVRLAVVNAVSVLTGLSSDKISVVKWKS